MTEYQRNQLALLKSSYPDLVHEENGGLWVRISQYPLPENVWGSNLQVSLCFKIPDQPAIQPYGFWVFPQLILAGEVQGDDHYQADQSTPFGQPWGLFSWSPLTWHPREPTECGDNMLTFVRSFAERLSNR